MHESRPLHKWYATGSRMLLDTLFPALCPRCNETVDMPGSLCSDCWSSVTFISAPKCGQCGLPFDYDVTDDMLCGNCITKPPPFSCGISVFRYDDNSRDMVLAFKHADRTDRAPAFAGWMKRAAIDILEKDPLIAPVPLHRKRLLKRRYNQAALLAKQLAKQTKGRLAVDMLLRTKDTASQGTKSMKARFRNVQGAFAIHPKWHPQIAGEHILLIDDVYTTGATLGACATCLLKAGAARVDILTLCRVVHPSSLSI